MIDKTSPVAVDTDHKQKVKHQYLENILSDQSHPYINSDTFKKSVDNTKKLIDKFQENISKKTISEEGSMILCALISLKGQSRISIDNLPDEDQKTLQSLLTNYDETRQYHFDVRFDHNKDFVFSDQDQEGKGFVINIFNALVHLEEKPKPNDVTIEKDGDELIISDKLKIHRKVIAKATGKNFYNGSSESEDDAYIRRQPVSGRNAYEIRSDILADAIDTFKTCELGRGKHYKEITDEILEIAGKFYEFVENKNLKNNGNKRH